MNKRRYLAIAGIVVVIVQKMLRMSFKLEASAVPVKVIVYPMAPTKA